MNHRKNVSHCTSLLSSMSCLYLYWCCCCYYYILLSNNSVSATAATTAVIVNVQKESTILYHHHLRKSTTTSKKRRRTATTTRRSKVIIRILRNEEEDENDSNSNYNILSSSTTNNNENDTLSSSSSSLSTTTTTTTTTTMTDDTSSYSGEIVKLGNQLLVIENTNDETNGSRFSPTSKSNRNNNPNIHKSNLVLPPKDSFELCHLPDTSNPIRYTNFYNNNNNNNTLSDDDEIKSFTILVQFNNNNNECDVSQKIYNAMIIQKILQPSYIYLLFYDANSNNDDNNNNNNNDDDGDNSITTIIDSSLTSTSSNIMESSEHYNNIGIIVISTNTASSLLQHIYDHQIHLTNTTTPTATTDISPFFLEDSHIYWHFPIEIERIINNDDDDDIHDDLNYNIGDDDSIETPPFLPKWLTLHYLLLLFFVPAILISIGYSKWKAGMRIQFRRDSSGNITGVEIHSIPTTRTVLTRRQLRRRRRLRQRRLQRQRSSATTLSQQDDNTKSNLLTSDQVLALPEIEYNHNHQEQQFNEDDQKQEDNLNIASLNGSNHHPSHDNDIHIHMEQICNEEQHRQQSSNNVAAATNISSTTNNNMNANVEITANSSATSSSSSSSSSIDNIVVPFDNTCCSICLLEYEIGDSIRLLPNCKHTFHTDCIMEWLVERQGSCPLCKTLVLKKE